MAALAGVSIATVSRALANPDRVNAKTRAHVLEVVRRTGYTPNVAGRSLRAARSMMVLVVVPTFITPFFTDLLLGVDRALTDARLRPADRQPAGRRREGGARWSIWSAPVRSTACCCSTARSCAAPRRSLADVGMPMVAVSVPPTAADVPAVLVQEREGAAAVARHLLELGHRRFGYVTGPAGSYIEARALGRLPRDAGGGRHRRRRRSSAIPAISTSRSGVAAGEPFLRRGDGGRPRCSPSAT